MPGTLISKRDTQLADRQRDKLELECTTNQINILNNYISVL